VAQNPVPQNLLLDLSPVMFSTTSVTSQVVEARTGKMVNANKLAALQKKKWEKHVLIGPFSNDLTKQKKCEN
jgi:hypothetical protein